MAQARSFGSMYALVLLALACSSASGQLVVAGCMGGSCNPTAHGGNSLSSSQGTQSTSVQQPPQQAGGNPFVDLLGVLGPFADVLGGSGGGGAAPKIKPGGRKLMMHQEATADSTSMRQLKQLTVVGCAQGSCNPTATGGTSISTSSTTQVTEVKPAPQESSGGGNPIGDFFNNLFGGRRLMGVQGGGEGKAPCAESAPFVFSASEEDTAADIALLEGLLAVPEPEEDTSADSAPLEDPAADSAPADSVHIADSAPSGGLRRLQCVEPNLAQCRAWGPSQCGMPGVNDRCPCMCSGLSVGGPGPQGTQGPPVIIISQETTAVGCKDGSCNPNAQGGNGGRR